MRFILIVITLICMFCLPQPVFAANRALLIGVGKYQMKGIDLPGIDKDVGMMREVALALGYKKNEIKVLLNEKATLKNVRNALKSWLIKGVNKDDKVLFYFSGHGTQIYDRNKDEPDKADEVLVLHDASLGVNTLNNVFVDDMFNDILDQIPSKNVFIMIDACHSGTATRSFDGASYGIVPKYLEYPGMPKPTRSTSLMDKSIQNAGFVNYAALSAAQDNQRAQASKQGSFFTRGLMDSVRKASRKGRKLDMIRLHEETTKYISQEMPSPSLVHSPALVGNLALNSKNMFIEKKTTKPPPPTPSWITEIRNITDKASYSVSTKTNRTVFKIGQPLKISCVIKRSGYLNVVTIQPGEIVPTVLFPNEFHPENRVKAGQTISIPAAGDNYELTASLPKGKAIIAVFHTSFPVNFYKQGYGSTAFKSMSRSSTRGFIVQEKPKPSKPEPEAPKPPRYGASLIHMRIK